MIRFIKLIGLSSALTIEVEGFVYFFLRGSLVDADVADATEQSEVDAARRVLLVMRHEFEKDGVVIAGDGHTTVVFADETDGLAHLVGGEVGLGGAQVEFADKAESHEVTMEQGRLHTGDSPRVIRCAAHRGDSPHCAQRKGFERMAHGVAEVEGFAEAVLQGILGDDALLDGHAVCQHALKGGEV